MHENIMSKASSVLALLYGVRNAGIEKTDVEYVIDCAEEACGDMNQRGGGNFAKAAAEVAGLLNATGSDSRGFCAGPDVYKRQVCKSAFRAVCQQGDAVYFFSGHEI